MPEPTRPLLFAAILALPLTTGACAQSDGVAPDGPPVDQGRANVPDFQPAFPNQTRAPAMRSQAEPQVATFADGLAHPWGIATLPDGEGFLVTEHDGRMRHVDATGEVGPPIAGVPEVVAEGQGGLLDVAAGPNFAADRTVFWTYTKPVGGGRSATAAARGVLDEDRTRLTDVRDIFVQSPGSRTPRHFGSRIVFDGRGHAFITTGERSSDRERVYAQDLDKTYGKVIRVALDGSTPQGNPFAGRSGAIDTIWSYGHRNIQGALWHDGQLWTVEHGPRGGDELNAPEPGRNYGWPVVSYGERYSGRPIGSGEPRGEGFEEPVYYWDPVIAPGGMDVYDAGAFPGWRGDVLIGSLNPGGIVRLKLQDGRVVGEERLVRELGRVRDVEVLDDGSVLAALDRTAGRIVRLTPAGASN